MKLHFTLSFILFLLVFTPNTHAQSPANLNSDVNWTDTGGEYDPGNGIYNADFDGVVDIEAAFNNARRQEEIQLGLSTNAISNLDLPTQSIWDTYGVDEKVLYIMNDERVCRVGINYGNGAVKGLPYTGIEENIDGIAQTYANLLLTNNATGHNEGGNSPFDRIDNDPIIGNGACNGSNGHQFLPQSENLAYFWTSGPENDLILERSIYNWIYDDAGSGWGHRTACLLQDQALNGQSGFTDDNGDDTEGYIGIGVSGANNGGYNPYGWGWVNRGDIVVLNFFDQMPDGTGCNYSPRASLPVELFSFSGQAIDKAIELAWITASEIENDFFAIERSMDGKEFEEIGYVEGAGTSTDKQHYSFNDYLPENGINYYRLAQYDMDGKLTFSKIITILYTEPTTVAVFPNPAHDEIFVSIDFSTQQKVKFEIYNVTGELLSVEEREVYAGQYVPFNISSFENGLYMLKVNSGGITETIRFFKN